MDEKSSIPCPILLSPWTSRQPVDEKSLTPSPGPDLVVGEERELSQLTCTIQKNQPTTVLKQGAARHTQNSHNFLKKLEKIKKQRTPLEIAFEIDTTFFLIFLYFLKIISFFKQILFFIRISKTTSAENFITGAHQYRAPLQRRTISVSIFSDFLKKFH